MGGTRHCEVGESNIYISFGRALLREPAKQNPKGEENKCLDFTDLELLQEKSALVDAKFIRPGPVAIVKVNLCNQHNKVSLFHQIRLQQSLSGK